MSTEIVILVGHKIGGTITEISGDAVADVDHDVIDILVGLGTPETKPLRSGHPRDRTSNHHPGCWIQCGR